MQDGMNGEIAPGADGSIPELILAVHGTRSDRGYTAACALRDELAREVGAEVGLCFADVREPTLGQLLLAGDPARTARVVPAFLSAGYHVCVDLPQEAKRSGRQVEFTQSLGPSRELDEALAQAAFTAGARPFDRIVVAAVGSSSAEATAQVHRSAQALTAIFGAPASVGFLGSGEPVLRDALREAQRESSAVFVAARMLAPGVFHDHAMELLNEGAAGVSEPLYSHPLVIERLVRLLAGSTDAC